MTSSLSRRIFRTIFAIGAINVLVTLIAVEFIYEDMEDAILHFEMAEERAFLENRIDGPRVHSWHSALLTALYLPDGAEDVDMPELFAGRSVPFSAEVEIGEKTYLISIERTAEPPGVLYLAQDISVLEDREDLMQWIIVALCIGMLLLGLLLARHGTRLVVRPLQHLTQQIRRIEPGTPINRIESAYAEHELAEIAATLNDMLVALDAYVQREKSLVSLASHELRTPLAVIAGALDVLERRGSLGEADRRTMLRIRRAADEMRSDVNALLKLARRSDGEDDTPAVDLRSCIDEVVNDIDACAPDTSRRIVCNAPEAPPRIDTDPALVRMLLRNLIQNAVRHTRGQVHIDIGARHLTISDQGAGLPQQGLARLDEPIAAQPVPDDGLGLFIVRLICERLGWHIVVSRSGPSGTVIALHFPDPPPPARRL